MKNNVERLPGEKTEIIKKLYDGHIPRNLFYLLNPKTLEMDKEEKRDRILSQLKFSGSKGDMKSRRELVQFSNISGYYHFKKRFKGVLGNFLSKKHDLPLLFLSNYQEYLEDLPEILCLTRKRLVELLGASNGASVITRDEVENRNGRIINFRDNFIVGPEEKRQIAEDNGFEFLLSSNEVD